MSQYGRGYYTASSPSQFQQQQKSFPQDDDFEYDHGGSSFNQNSKRPSPWSNSVSENQKKFKPDRNDYFDSINTSNYDEYDVSNAERNYNSNIIENGNVSVNGNYGSYSHGKNRATHLGYNSSNKTFDGFQATNNSFNGNNLNSQHHFKHGQQEYRRNHGYSENGPKNDFSMARSSLNRTNGGSINSGFGDKTKDYCPPVELRDFDKFNGHNSGTWNKNQKHFNSSSQERGLTHFGESDRFNSSFVSSNNSSQYQNSLSSDSDSKSGNFSQFQRYNSKFGSVSSDQNDQQSQNQSTPCALAPELSMPVFQTFDKTDSWTSTMVRQTFKRNSSSVDRITAKSEKAEEWAWSSGKKWNVPNPVKPKLNLYAAAPKVEQIHAAPRVSGGIGEKLLQKMGWNKGEGLGKTGAGEINPIGFNEIKTDRKGLQDGYEKSVVSEEKSVDRTQSKFQEIKSKSFWSWHSGGMKGPEDFRERIKVAKKEAKVAKQKIQETTPVDVSDKHPVSALMELCQKRGWQEPRFTEERSHKGFRFAVQIQGQSYQPPAYCDNKKLAKKDCAHHCLVTMGLIPSNS